ncbi:MAG: hypothetical protein PF693_15650 [Spirochaetia bacterium]|jgi:hypothetical protein|nr:hypothetical protein [Spirochaetia bacterium]
MIIDKDFKEFGFMSISLKPDDFLTSGNVVQLGYPPSRIDLFTKKLL